MKARLFKLLSSALITSSFIMMIGSNFSNFINYIFHLLVGRMLGPAGYGDIASIISFIGLIGIIPTSLNLVIVKLVSSTKENSELQSTIDWLAKRALIIGIGLGLLIVIATPVISTFLNIYDNRLLMLIGVTLLFSIPASFNRSILQGLLRFKQLIISFIVENLSKVILAIGLIALGFGVFGVILGIVVSTLVGLIVTYWLIGKKDKAEKRVSFSFKQLSILTLPIMLQTISMTSLYSADLLLVKHFFSSHQSGIYASLSTLGKIIFFATGPISTVMFPMIVSLKSKKSDFMNVFWISFLITLMLCLMMVAIYYVFPELVINLLYGGGFKEAGSLLFLISIVMGLYALSSLCINFALSVDRPKVVFLPIVVSILQVIGILVFHEGLTDIILVTLSCNILLLFSLLIDIYLWQKFKLNA